MINLVGFYEGTTKRDPVAMQVRGFVQPMGVRGVHNRCRKSKGSARGDGWVGLRGLLSCCKEIGGGLLCVVVLSL
jgi:hypothetical protein